MLCIKDLKLDNPLILAPMAGITDLPFRMMSRKYGCELAFVEMTSARAIVYSNRKTNFMLRTIPEDKPLGIQLLGHEAEYLIKALDIIASLGFAVIDFNAACPVKKITRNEEGASLLRTPRKLSTLLRAMVGHSDVPVTVKIRSGWDDASINARDVALHAQDAGISALFIHGRTRTQQYSGRVNYDIIREVKEALEIPVIASGDVLSPELSKKMLDETGSDGVLMARGALGNPWIFNETAEFLKSGTLPHRPAIQEIKNAMVEHLSLSGNFYGPERAVRLFRKLFVWYTRGIHGIKPFREKAMRTMKMEDLIRIIDEISETGNPISRRDGPSFTT